MFPSSNSILRILGNPWNRPNLLVFEDIFPTNLQYFHYLLYCENWLFGTSHQKLSAVLSAPRSGQLLTPRGLWHLLQQGKGKGSWVLWAPALRGRDSEEAGTWNSCLKWALKTRLISSLPFTAHRQTGCLPPCAFCKPQQTH